MEFPQLDHLKMVSLVPITWSSGSILGHESVSHVINDYDGCNQLHFVHVYVRTCIVFSFSFQCIYV